MSAPLSNRCPAGPGDGTRSAEGVERADRSAAGSVWHLPPLAGDRDDAGLDLPVVRALRHRLPLPALPEPAGRPLRGLRTHRERLTPAPGPAILPATSRRAGNERDEYPSIVGRETRWLVETGATTAGNGPGSLRTEREGRIGGTEPVGSGAERQRYRAAPIARSHDPAVGHASAASPNEGGTAEGTTFRPGTIRSFLILEANAMSTADPISLAQAKRLRRQRRHDPAARHAPGRPRDARSAPSSASTTAARPTSWSPSRAASDSAAIRSSASARAGCSRSATARPASRPGPSPCRPTPRTCRSTRSMAADPLDAIRALRPAPPGPADRGHAALHRRRRRRAGLRRDLDLRAVRAAARSTIRSASRRPPSSRPTSSSSSTT